MADDAKKRMVLWAREQMLMMILCNIVVDLRQIVPVD